MAAALCALALLRLLPQAIASATPDAACDAGEAAEEAALLQSGSVARHSSPRSRPSQPLTILAPDLKGTPFGPYFNYHGPLQVQGTVLIFGSPDVADEMNVTWDLSGLDPACVEGAAPDVANACGLHVHDGKSCDSDAGPHYHKNLPDPWKPVRYVVTPEATSTGSFSLEIGFPFSSANGRAFVVHDVTGARVGCALLAGTSLHTYNDQCEVGQSVPCFGSGNQCAGNQCCPRVIWTGNKTYPCPSASSPASSNCEVDYEVATCTR